MGRGGWVRIDVEKSSSHQLSQREIAGDNPCSRQLFEKALADGGGLSGAVDADDEQDARGRGVAVPVGSWGRECENFRDLIFQLALQVFGFNELVLIDLLAERGEDFFCGANADVLAEQCGLELVQKLGVDGTIARKDLLDFRRELRLRLADGIFQALEERGFGWSEESNHVFAALGGNKYSSRRRDEQKANRCD
jgi:hypothetical protein